MKLNGPIFASAHLASMHYLILQMIGDILATVRCGVYLSSAIIKASLYKVQSSKIKGQLSTFEWCGGLDEPRCSSLAPKCPITQVGIPVPIAAPSK